MAVMRILIEAETGASSVDSIAAEIVRSGAEEEREAKILELYLSTGAVPNLRESRMSAFGSLRDKDAGLPLRSRALSLDIIGTATVAEAPWSKLHLSNEASDCAALDAGCHGVMTSGDESASRTFAAASSSFPKLKSLARDDMDVRDVCRSYANVLSNKAGVPMIGGRKGLGSVGADREIGLISPL